MSMENRARLEGKALDDFLEVLAYIAERRERTGHVRVCVDDGYLKLKVDEGVWSPPMGRPDDK